jgi:hypothetical protein
MLTSLLLIMATAVMPLPALASWSDSASVSGSPEEVLNGETVTFSFGLTINAVEGVDTVNITSVTAQFEWVTETLFSGIETVTDSDSNVVTSDALVVTVSAAGTTSAGSLDWTTMAMLVWIAIFVVAGLLLVRPRR